MTTHERDTRRKDPIAYSYTRFSSTKQQEGTSLERQTRMAQEWAERNGYRLADENYEDLGVSAFKGKNIERGALGAFVDAARRGVFPEKTVLLIEDASRMSRAGIMASIMLLKEITEYGIDIVFLRTNHRISAGSLNDLSDMVRIIVEAESAAQESRHKSDRLQHAWHMKREDLAKAGKRLTGMVPGWLEPIRGGNGFRVKPAEAAVVRRIFEERVKGYGTAKIAYGLNRDKIPTFRYGKAWQRSTIQLLLRSKSPIGTLVYGPGRGEKNEMPDYYPAIISQELWEAAQAVKPQTSHGGHGPLRTPFGWGLARCGACGANMGTAGHAGGKQGVNKLACVAAKLGKPCKGETVTRSPRGRRRVKSLPLGEVIQALEIELPRMLDRAPSVEAEAVRRLESARGEVEYWTSRAFDRELAASVRAKAHEELDAAEAEVTAWTQVLSEAAGPLVQSRFDRLREALRTAAGATEIDAEDLGAALRGVFRRMVFNWSTETWTATWRHVDETIEFPATMRALGFDVGSD